MEPLFKHVIKEAVSCDSSNCIYYWKCIKPNCQDYPRCEYVGKTIRAFKDRLAEHRDYPKRDMVNEPAGKHFTLPGHDVSHLWCLVLEKVKSKDLYVLKPRVWFFSQLPMIFFLNFKLSEIFMVIFFLKREFYELFYGKYISRALLKKIHRFQRF